MLEYREDPGSGVVEITVDGRITRAQFDDIAARLEAHIARHGKVRLLEEVRSIGGIDPATFWADVRFSLRHLREFDRCAVVADQRWIEWLAKGVDRLVACEVRHFPSAEIDAARRWLQTDPPAAPQPGS